MTMFCFIIDRTKQAYKFHASVVIGQMRFVRFAEFRHGLTEIGCSFENDIIDNSGACCDKRAQTKTMKTTLIIVEKLGAKLHNTYQEIVDNIYLM